MTSFNMFIYFLILFIIANTEGGKKSSIDKIIIHVPYKIHKHHHTHTKYKVITIPAPKKENTVIYLKEDIQPIIQHVHPAHTYTEVVENHSKMVEPFIPPHQESASALLKDLAKPTEETHTQTDQQHQYSTILEDQKPLESHASQTTEGFVPGFTFKPMILPPQDNLIPNFSFKSVLHHQDFTPKFIIHDFLPKFPHQPILHQTSRFPQFKATKPHSKDLQDSFAQMSNQVYKTIRPKVVKSYKVKEENMEDHKRLNINRIPVPPMKFNRKGKSLHPGFSNQIKNMLMKPDPDYEYEHVGYLIIDENSRKIVGKNFKDEIHLS